jgi:cytochrome c oxidase cbb3-type subunit 3/ubiquinol-cytochrome c reductase cytochrome c subunit
LYVVLTVLLAACTNQGAAKTSAKRDAGAGVAPIAADAATVVDLTSAKATYLRLCAPCHAADGKGYAADFAPSLVNPTFLESASDDFVRRSIVFGRPGTSMGAYGKALGGPLDDAEVEKLVAWIRAQGPKAKTLTAVAQGDPSRGAPLYNEYCKSCHGDPTKRGEAPHLANIQFLTIATDSFIRYAIEVGRPGTKMLAFGAVMTPAQIDDVTAYVRTLSQGATQLQLLPEPTGKEPLVVNPTGKNPTWKPRDNRFIGVDAVAKALAEKKKLIIIDARPPSDWRRVHIAGAVSIPYHDMKRLDEIVAKHKDTYVVAYCACPHHLSGIVIDELVKRGHTKALVLDEGINLWHQKKYPVTAAEGVVAPALEPQHDHAGHGH